MGASSQRWLVEASILLLQFAMGLSFLAVAPLFPLIIDAFEVSRASVSLLVGGTALGVALALVPSSVLVARVGTQRALALGGTLMSAMLFAPLASSFPLLLAARLTFACGAAVTLTATPPIVMRWFPPRELPVINGINVVGQSLGITTSMALGPRLAAALGWDVTLGIFGGATALATVVWLLAGRIPAPAGAEDEAAAPLPLQELASTLRQRSTVLLAIGMMGALGGNVAFGSWLPAYYHEQFDYSLERAGEVGALLALFGIAGALLGSTLPVRFPRRRPFLIAAGTLMPLAALGTLLGATPFVMLPSVALFGVLSWIFIPVVFTIPMELPGMSAARVGMTVAVFLSAGNLSGFLVPLVVGSLRDQTGALTAGLVGAAVLPAAMAVAGYLMPETGRATGAQRVAPDSGQVA